MSAQPDYFPAQTHANEMLERLRAAPPARLSRRGLGRLGAGLAVASPLLVILSLPAPDNTIPPTHTGTESDQYFDALVSCVVERLEEDIGHVDDEGLRESMSWMVIPGLGHMVTACVQEDPTLASMSTKD